MAKIHGLKWVVCLASSILINIFFVLNIDLRRSPELTWSREAAVEAEAVAAVSCSGHGRAFLDGSTMEGIPACECNSCYGGPHCSEFSPDGCPLDVDLGDPLFLEPFWMQHSKSSAVVVAGWHRMSYSDGIGSSILFSKELTNHIFQLHALVGNAITKGRFILFGVGSSQLLHAAVHALSQQGSSHPACVVATAPFYPLYEFQTELFDSEDFKFQGDTTLWKNTSSANSSTNIIEFVTSPNNPDGRLTKPVLQGPSVKTIHDHAYYWPHFTAIQGPADEDLMLFTLSKVTGHGGSRFGWALIKDKDLYQRMLMYLSLNTIGVSQDTQLRALKILKVVLKGGGEIFEFGYNTMKARWERLNEILSASRRFSIQKLEPQYCNYFQNVTGPSPAYAWLKCEREEDLDCHAVLKAASIIGRKGNLFRAESRYVRLSLIKYEDDFDLLLHRIKVLVSKEEGSKNM
ncbi:hypothetical protein NE237_019162 [Protea cynaroides]|uniref:Tryptophan aminotransferase-related protein 4-like n=1 Tax=Protea cynaroides TaxID=273540 RepID=A0A9Q0KB74_9MAGN|nr:hypothetical protein NE237_019162 [Protea cynaroides]